MTKKWNMDIAQGSVNLDHHVILIVPIYYCKTQRDKQGPEKVSERTAGSRR
jgi:hypothetical protein